MKRCAIYTRKSTQEGLDQSFNSLDAQREACENYVLSQKSEGWKAIKTRYDDGGLSGGNMERPALKSLMNDIDAGKVDIVVVYKVDRLTRSLADFAKLVERFDKHEVSFVSVTQQFNTSNSMGRLTLNVLLSFAQFEREVGAERVRDKIAASRKKGMWTGGNPPLGYDNIDRKLVVVENEAKIIQAIFAQYLEHQSVPKIVSYAADQKWTTKKRTNGTGGKPLTRGPIYHMLKNPIYAGLMRTGGKLYPSQHKAIIDRKAWDAVQQKLESRTQWTGHPRSDQSPLTGKIYWNGRRLTPSHTRKRGKIHRYYISDANKLGITDRIRLKANEAELAVANAIATWASKPVHAAAAMVKGNTAAAQIREVTNCVKVFGTAFAQNRNNQSYFQFLERVDISGSDIAIRLLPQSLISKRTLHDSLQKEALIESSLALKKRGQELRFVVGEQNLDRALDQTLISLLTKVYDWKEKWFSDPEKELREILIDSGCTPTGHSRELRLAFLAPDIVDAFLTGNNQMDITAEKLKRLIEIPIDWDAQQELFGIVP